MKRVFAILAMLAVGARAGSAAPQQAAPQLEVTPATDFYSSGPQGGFFYPSVQVYDIKNTGMTPLTFTSTVDQPWVSILLTSNTINPGENWGDAISINSQANTLAPGTYTATVTFTNATNGAGNTTRTVRLIVGTPGDASAPTVTITSPAPPLALTASSPVTVSGTASDNLGVTSMYWFNMQTNDSGSLPGAATWNFSLPLAAGDNQVYVWAWDASGNQGTASITIRYGTTVGTQMDVTPASGFTAAGPVGGPFNPATQVYTVTNLGPGVMGFSATATQPWVSIFAGGAMLAAGDSWSVVVMFTGAANGLSAGTHSDTVTFTNITNGSGNTSRPVSLVVGSSSDLLPPSIAIVNPAPPTATSTTSPVLISGTASDNVGVASIAWSNALTGQSGTIGGASTWTLTVPLGSGSNPIAITAWDAAGNSASSSLTVDLAAGGPAAARGRDRRHNMCSGAIAADRGGFPAALLAAILLLGLAAVPRRKG